MFGRVETLLGIPIPLTMLITLLLQYPAGAQDIVGRGEWQSTKAGGVKGTWSATLTQADDVVRGALTIDGSNVFSGGTVEGTLAAGRVILGVFQEGAKVAHFAGKLDDGAVAGEWEAPAVADQGVWEGRLSGTLE